MNDTTGTVDERVVEAPAKRATGYGDDAVAQGVRVAQGDRSKPKVAPKPPPPQPTAPQHVMQARAIWRRAFADDAQRRTVRIDDLKAHSDRHRAARPDVGRLSSVGYQAWTNSRRDIYVSPTLFRQGGTAMPGWFPEALLRHEAIHVQQFASANDAVPTYLEMILAEATAYAETVRWLDTVTPLPADAATYDGVCEQIEAVVTKLTDRSKVAATELEHKAWMVTEQLLPEHTPSAEQKPRPSSLYVR